MPPPRETLVAVLGRLGIQPICQKLFRVTVATHSSVSSYVHPAMNALKE